MRSELDNANFGDKFQTKDGRMAVYLKWSNEVGGIDLYEFAIKHNNNDNYDILVLPETDILSSLND